MKHYGISYIDPTLFYGLYYSMYCEKLQFKSFDNCVMFQPMITKSWSCGSFCTGSHAGVNTVFTKKDGVPDPLTHSLGVDPSLS